MLLRRSVLLQLLVFGLWSTAVRCAEESVASRQFAALLEDAWETSLKESPLFATSAGEHRFNDRLDEVSLADQQRRYDQGQQVLKRLAAIDREKLTRDEQIHFDIFRRLRSDQLQEFEFQTHLMPISNRWGFHIAFPDLRKKVPLDTAGDYENYLARLSQFGRYTDQHIELMRQGIKQGLTLPGVVLKDYRLPIESQIVTDPEKSLFFEPLKELPAAINAEDRERLRARARQVIQTDVVPAYQRFLEFMEQEYVPACRGSIAASALPQGRAYYRYCVKKFTTLDVTPESVHQTGLAEVKRIKQEMHEVMQEAKFAGDFAEFVEFLRTDPRFYAETPEALMKEVAWILKRMDGKLPEMFGRLPPLPCGLREVPAYIAPSTSAAYYMPPPGDGSRAGFYYVNTYDLKSRPLYMLEALSLHEAVPGHHLQLALQIELAHLPNFRRHAGFTAFIEGWALYAERLGLEVGFYEDPYQDFGRLNMEMWRACRLVVDTGIHYFGWSRQRAIQYMAENSAMSRHNIRTEVDRYIAWPGQALAYKTGELKIRQLRKLAETEMADKFDLRKFHDVVLGSGSVPLPVLEENVRRFIAAQAEKAEKE